MADTQTWFVSGKCLGSAPIGQERTHNLLHRPVSYAFSCMCCGEVWARRVISPSPTRWFFWAKCCPDCAKENPNRLHTPGSIWMASDDTYLANLPDFMLRYEAVNCCKFWGY
jgi:hypothetical protein